MTIKPRANLNLRWKSHDAYTKAWLSYAALMLLQYVVSMNFFTMAVCYGLLFPFMILSAFKEETDLPAYLRQPLVAGFCILFLYILLHGAFIEKASVKTIANAAATAGFFLCSLLFFSADRKTLNKFFALLAVVAGIGAIISIYLYLIGYSPSIYNDTRLSPIGRGKNPVLGALLFGSAGLVSLYCAKITRSKTHRSVFIAIAILISILELLTQSRAPALIYLLCVCIATGAYGAKRSACLSALSALGLFALAYGLIPDVHDGVTAYIDGLVARDDGSRLPLWHQVIEKIRIRPWLGYGLQERLLPTAENPSVYAPHNIYLATLFYLGIPGGMLFLALILKTAIDAGRLLLSAEPLGVLAALLFLQGALSGMTEHAQLVKTVSPLWFIFWMPISLVITQFRQEKWEARPRLTLHESTL